jgi:hypothetical protein
MGSPSSFYVMTMGSSSLIPVFDRLREISVAGGVESSPFDYMSWWDGPSRTSSLADFTHFGMDTSRSKWWRDKALQRDESKGYKYKKKI